MSVTRPNFNWLEVTLVAKLFISFQNGALIHIYSHIYKSLWTITVINLLP